MTKFLIGSGLSVAILGTLVLIFQAVLLLIFGQWYSFSILDLLVRFDLHDYLVTGVPGIDATMDWVLDMPLPLVLIVIGGLVAFVAYRVLMDDIRWSRPD